MYLKHFGLTEQPFSLTPDTHFFLNATSHHEALNLLLVTLDSSEGFIKITGEVGTGKTLICRKLLNTLDQEKFVTAYIPNPDLNSSALTNAFAEELGIKITRGTAKHKLMEAITQKLIFYAGHHKQVVLLIDEAQSMPEETLEALRLLTNLETEKRKLLQVVLFAQPELDYMLAKHHLRQLKQRITFSYQLQPFDREGVAEYVTHRLLTAGYNGPALFTQKAIKRLHRATAGIPRVINILSHKAMLAAFGEGERSVELRHVVASIRDSEGNYMAKWLQWRWCILTGVLGLGGGILLALFGVA
jgi:MSHA biogenesis protein MshM